MMKVNFLFPEGIELFEPASIEQIGKLEVALGGKLCPMHKAFLLLSNGAEHGGDGENFTDDVSLFGVDEIQEMQTSYQVETYSPGFYVIGVESGSRVALLRLGGNPSPVFSSDPGDMRSEDFCIEGSSLSKWLNQRVRFQVYDED